MPGPGSRKGSVKKKIVEESGHRDNRSRIDKKVSAPTPGEGVAAKGDKHSGQHSYRRIGGNIYLVFNFQGEERYILSTVEP